MSSHEEFHVKPATPDDVATLLRFIKGLAEYEGLSEELIATEDDIRDSFFGLSLIHISEPTRPN